MLQKVDPIFRENFKVFIVDNGNTLFIKDIDWHFEIFPNKNLGGSGGFTRGLVEVLKQKDFTHFCFMDDDVEIDPFAFEKLFFFYLSSNEKAFNSAISGSILRLDNPTFQYEKISRWNGIFTKFINKNLDLSKPESILENSKILSENQLYSPWCLTSYPLKIVNENGLPLPLFIRGDDVEFGVRNKLNPLSINGFCVWHETISPSKSRAWIVYYNTRNYILINLFHNITGKLGLLLFLFFRLGYYFLKKENLKIQNFNSAILDLERNPFFWEKDSEDFHKGLFNKKSEGSIFKNFLISFGNIFKFIIKYNDIRNKIKPHFKYLTSEEFWIKYL